MRLALLGSRYERQVHDLFEQIDNLDPTEAEALVKQLGRPDLSNIYNVIAQLNLDESRWAVVICPVPVDITKRFIRLLLITADGGKLAIFSKEQLSGGRGLIFEFFGQIEDTNSRSNDFAPAIWTFNNNPDGPPLRVQYWLMRAAQLGSPMVAQIHWDPTFGDQLRRTIEIEGNEWNKAKLEVASTTAIRALMFLHGVVTRPGPTPGTVEAAKYTNVEEWHAALHTVALAKPIRTEIKTQIVEVVAGRLSIGGTTISPTTVRRYMDRWGPRTHEELRNGKWNCGCHSCKS